MKRLNLVIIPKEEKIQNQLIQLSERYFDETDGYQLKKGASYPHISIAQVEVSNEAFDSVKETLLQLMEKNQQTISVSLQEVLYTKDGGWNELRPTPDSAKGIRALHGAVCSKLFSQGFKVSNAYGEKFVPHFTLAKEPDLVTQKTTSLPLGALKFPFDCTVAVGVADNKWQLVKLFSQQLDQSHDTAQSERSFLRCSL